MSAGSNQFGRLFQWTTFGESHGPAMGVVIDGCPSGLKFDFELLKNNLKSRRPGHWQSESVVSGRQEPDEPEVLSGIFENLTLGTPIAIIVRNKDQRSKDYDDIKNKSRAGHADDLWRAKFGQSDHRGGGRASARETLNWVMAGSVAQMFCLNQKPNIQVKSQMITVGDLEVTKLDDPRLIQKLKTAQAEGESFGATVGLSIQQCPPLLGEPVFLKLKSELARAMMMINACTAVELGDGFLAATKKGSDLHHSSQNPVYGGIRGGITTGEEIRMKMAFKPTSTIGKLAQEGRHDPCVALRALPIIEAMTWCLIADQLLMARLNRLT